MGALRELWRLIKAGKAFLAGFGDALEQDALDAWNTSLAGRSNREIDELLDQDDAA